MMTFKEFLSEELNPRIRHDVSHRTLLALNQTQYNTRFVAGKSGRLHVGAAHDFIHNQLYHPEEKEVQGYQRAEGTISYNPSSGSHMFEIRGNNPEEIERHRKALSELGATEGKRRGDFSNITVVPMDTPEPKRRPGRR